MYLAYCERLFLWISGCSSDSDSGDESTETQMSKFCEPSPGRPNNAKSDITIQTSKSCEPFPGKPGNAKSDSTFQVYKMSSAIKPFPFLINASKRVGDGSVFVCILYSYKRILQIEHVYELCNSRWVGWIIYRLLY